MSSSTSSAESVKWFALPSGEAVIALSSDPENGLDSGEAARRLQKHGRNELPAPKKRGPLMRFLAQMNNMLIYVLLAAGAGKIFLGEYLDASVIFGVVIINSLLGFLQEGKAEKALESIRGMLSPGALVLRDGKTRSIPAAELVPGDVVFLQSGDKVPADLRLIESKSLRVEEAPLTGESVPVDKDPAPVRENAPVGDRRGMAYSGTLVVSGRARGVVVGTGAATEIGHINRMLSGVEKMDTPLLRQIEHFGKILTVVILLVAVLAFAYGVLFLGEPLRDMFKAVVGIAVAAIPEGLPAVVTITLAIGVRRMARRHAIIRRLPAVETLGSVSRICSDKTGTLTLNEMTVVTVVTARDTYRVTGGGYSPEGRIEKGGAVASGDPVLEKMALVSALCNDSEIHEKDGQWVLAGDPTEGALLPFAAKAGADRPALRSRFPVADSIPFESEHKFMATFHDSSAGGASAGMLLVKGAPDVLFPYCTHQELSSGEPAAFDRAFWEARNEEIARGGNRVLALAWLPAFSKPEGGFNASDLPRNLTLLGLAGIMDPPRPEAVDAIRECHGGGIRVTMITGDHAATAVSIAKMLGIGDGKTCLTGRDLDTMDDDALETKCRRVDVFARTSPEHKLRLVRAMQACGQVVSMTGDGVNDAPSLKQADVGVAMGIKGTEVSKEAAEMVLTDDHFASIAAAVREGRTVFNNIEKAILFMLPTNGGQALTILFAVLLGLTLPITPPQILWINMVTSITLALALSFEPHEKDVMLRPPRSVNRPLLDSFGIWRVAFISLLLLVFSFGTFSYLYKGGNGLSIELCRTAAVNALIIGQIAYLLNSRFLLTSSMTWKVFAGNRWVPLSILGVLVLQVLFTYAPWMQALFGTTALPFSFWLWLALGGVVLFLMVELEKLLLRTVRSTPESSNRQ